MRSMKQSAGLPPSSSPVDPVINLIPPEQDRMPAVANTATRSIPNLDLLRSIAVLLVVAEHTLLAMGLHHVGRWDISWLGVTGVFMFFVHTCLVLMWSLERRPFTLDFYVRRAFRIYPLAITAILLVVLFHIPSMHDLDGLPFFKYDGARNLLSNLLLVQNLGWGGNLIGVMWSLPLEVDMYFLLPFLFAYVRRTKELWPILALWAATALYDRSAVPADSSTFTNCIPYFLGGVISYLGFAKWRPILPGWVLPFAILALVGAFMISPSWRHGWWFTLVLGLALPLFRPIHAKWLITASHQLAKYSYGIYLFHPFAIVLGINVLRGYSLPIRLGSEALAIAATVIPAYHFLEKPMIDVGARLASRLDVAAAERQI